jgi:hypothetical protein
VITLTTTQRVRASELAPDPARICPGRLDVHLPYTYPSADDRADANYASQPAVNSYDEEDP